MGSGRRSHRARTLALLLLAAAIGVPAFLALYSFFDLFGLAGALGLVSAVGLIVAIAWCVHLFRTFEPEIVAAARAIGTAAVRAAEAQPPIAVLGRKLTPVGRFIRGRLDRSTPRGLFLTCGLLVTGVLLLAFTSIARQVVGHGVITQVDVRIADLSDVLHGGRPVRASTFFSAIGGAPVRIPLTVVVFLAIWIRKPSLRPAIGLVAVLVLGPAVSDLVRILVRRPRPTVGSIALPGSYSFPSGHATAAAAAFGYLGYLAMRGTRRLTVHVAIAVVVAALIVGVAYSRVVLGFHWASDVVAGVALGLAIAAAVATWVDVRSRRASEPRHRSGPAWQGVAVASAIVVAGFAIGSALHSPQDAPAPAALVVTRLAATSVDRAVIASLPLHSETLTGRTMEPVSLLLLGTRSQVEGAFAAAGWSQADPIDLHTVVRLYAAGLHHTAYPTAPVTPAFLAGRPQDLAFELEVRAGSVSERHHTRIWASGFSLADGTPIWVGTASLDDRVEVKLPVPIPNHHIAPAIDLERDFIARSLFASGLVATETRVQAVPPELGTNAAGDPFFTYGVAVVIDLG